jgi:trigger factor
MLGGRVFMLGFSRKPGLTQRIVSVKTSVEAINATRKSLVVSISADEIAAEEKALLKEFIGQARIPGFRPGKAPEAMVRKRYAKELQEELNRKLTSKAYEQGIKEQKLSVYAIVEFKDDTIITGQDNTLTFVVDVNPEVVLPEALDFEVNVTVSPVTDEEIDAAIMEIRNQRAEYNKVERAAEAGDYVRLSYEGKIGEQAVAEIAPDAPMYGKQAVTWEEAGSKDAPGVQAIIQGIVGMQAGDKKDVEETFADDFHVAALAGKTVTYAIEVMEVREKVLPAIDEAFLKTVQVETEEQLRERIKDDLVSRKDNENNQQKRQQILEKLNSMVELELPESAVESETQVILGDFMRRQLSQGVTREDLEKRQDELLNGAREAAVNRVKTQLILGQVAKVKSIKVEEQDINQRIWQEAMMSRTKPDQLVKELKKDRSRLMELHRGVLFNKALDFLVNQAKVTEASGN